MSSEPKAGGCDAGGIALVGAVSVAAIFYQAGDRVGLVPKELEGGAFNTFEEFVFVTGEAVFGGVVFEQRGTLGWLLGRRLTLGCGLSMSLRGLSTLEEFGN
jgi:hypothetical protein